MDTDATIAASADPPSLDVTRVTLELAPRSAPVWRVWPKSAVEGWTGACADGEVAVLTFADGEFQARLLGVGVCSTDEYEQLRAQTADKASVRQQEIVCLAAVEADEAVRFLMNSRLDAPAKYSLFVDQIRPDGKDTAALMLERLLGKHLANFVAADPLDKRWPAGTAIAVSSDARGHEILDGVVGMLAAVNVVGWTLVEKKDQPIQFIEGDELLELLDGWHPRPADHISVPHLLAPAHSAGPLRLTRELQLKDAGRIGDFFKAILTGGDQASVWGSVKKLLNKPPRDLPLACGVVDWRECPYLTSALRVSWAGGEKIDFHVSLSPLTTGWPAVPSFRTHRLRGRFDAWLHEKDGERFARFLPTGSSWAMLDDQGQPKPDLPLLAHLLTPSAGRKAEDESIYAGLYVRHVKEDEMVLWLDPAGIPLALGGLQTYHQLFDRHADVVLNTPRLALTVSPAAQELVGAESLQLDGPSGRLLLQGGANGEIKTALELKGADSHASVHAGELVKMTVGEGGTVELAPDALHLMGEIEVKAGKTTFAQNAAIGGELEVGG